MPTISCDKEELYKALGREYTTQEFDELCFQFGIELDEDTTNDPERSPSERPSLKIDIPANRYDMLCLEGIAQALNVFNRRMATPQYKLLPSTTSLTISPETSEIRPYAAAAILRGVKLDPIRYQSFIALQDKLHANLCRNRTLVAIGTHDFSVMEGPFTYEALKPEEINFVPLNQTQEINGSNLLEFYKDSKHLSRYLHIIANSPRYPVILDAKRRVCSLPPIINSEFSKISVDTRDIFIDVTATDKTKLEIVVNMMTTMFSCYCEEPFTIEPVNIISEHNGCTRVTPNLNPTCFKADIDYLNEACGLSLPEDEICHLLTRMMLTAKPNPNDSKTLLVYVPPLRADILHQCDIMEDLGIAYGYDNLKHTYPAHSVTFGKPFEVNRLADIIRNEVAYAGWSEVMPFILCSHDENYAWLRKTDDSKAVQLANPKTLEFQVVRSSLLPGILKTVRENKNHALPIKIFEVSDVAFCDYSRERMTRNERHLCAIFAGLNSGFEQIHGLLDRVMLMLNTKRIMNPKDSDAVGYWIEAEDDSTFFPGRCAAVYYRKDFGTAGIRVGVFGVLHPLVLEKFELTSAASAVEIDLTLWV
ncbi:Phenylalanine--tRNA ligase beta subunit [Schizosaccharomyces pombe]|uniref:Phenylalanine--tRNA ligase beta subunit n=1 Tax=Schizosaccharomyces pombe (strain 972 / ATCC 24843) TaxID=284812 RepID=SYFB_SCHPO|nr:putative phenylalanine--tRNA (Phe) ligase beta subunit Frs1 [Schizosaccharomyces pombe]O42849.1 RecName: Full=Phenylalanine--tRNA ligase beta subunit; AltName: Full=Phenylalanyl-tRNA synthetase beta subunit; Short=PheRS [Schizosaccharomyces pombe 972h-]CAA16986.1 phenylalanine-tRNA ligase beta subunit Frs1 (predicted) [Schizosaccharomyces pombe]|eukprot:NP_594442.1 putative phenylalanine--tRNA (Phe) ligase beta subunit Frs1 [Schizosaccharomyces pombe]